MSEWEDDSSFELPEDESWRGDQHAPADAFGMAIETWAPGMSQDEADDLLDDEGTPEFLDSEDATGEETKEACASLAKELDDETFLVAYLLYAEQDSIGEIAEALKVPPRKARILRDNLIEKICIAFERVCPNKTVDMEEAIAEIYSQGMGTPCRQCGDIQPRYAKYCTNCGKHRHRFLEELFYRIWGHSLAVEQETGCPKTHAEAATNPNSDGYCLVCGTHFPPKPQKP